MPRNDLGAATNDLFAKAMVIGPACPRQDCCGYCHLANIAHQPSKTSMIFSMPLLRTLELGMSAFTAGSTTPCTTYPRRALSSDRDSHVAVRRWRASKDVGLRGECLAHRLLSR